MGKIEKQVVNVILAESEKLKNDLIIKQLEQANDEFKVLLQKGLVKARGYNLLSVDNAHLKRYSFNSK